MFARDISNSNGRDKKKNRITVGGRQNNVIGSDKSTFLLKYIKHHESLFRSPDILNYYQHNTTKKIKTFKIIELVSFSNIFLIIYIIIHRIDIYKLVVHIIN